MMCLQHPFLVSQATSRHAVRVFTLYDASLTWLPGTASDEEVSERSDRPPTTKRRNALRATALPNFPQHTTGSVQLNLWFQGTAETEVLQAAVTKVQLNVCTANTASSQLASDVAASNSTEIATAFR
jgi:hypothetical protein